MALARCGGRTTCGMPLSLRSAVLQPGGRSFDLGRIGNASQGQSVDGVIRSGPGRTVFNSYDHAVTDSACRFLEERGAGQRPCR